MFYRFAHIVVGFLFRIFFNFKFSGRENVPQGGALLCCNHSSLSDPIFVALALKPADHPKFMAKGELFKFPPLKWLITSLGAYPIERGKSDLKAIRLSISKLDEGNKLLIFPEGTRVHEDEGVQAKTGVILLAVKSGKPLVPVRIKRKKRLIGQSVRVMVGSPYTVVKNDEKASADLYREEADRLMEHIRSLGEGDE